MSDRAVAQLTEVILERDQPRTTDPSSRWCGAILAFDIPRATALADAYIRSGEDRVTYQAAVALTACKFQDDPHNQKITHSSFEEYAHNSTHLRDRLLVAPVRLLAGWPKMPGEREFYARWEKEWSGS